MDTWASIARDLCHMHNVNALHALSRNLAALNNRAITNDSICKAVGHVLYEIAMLFVDDRKAITMTMNTFQMNLKSKII